MSIGYACIHMGSNKTKFSSIHLKTYTNEKLISIIENNLNALEEIIKYNIKNKIKLFRISSDIIPLASHEINDVEWWNIFNEKLIFIGKLIKDNGIRVSMHPGQYTIINSINKSVIKKSIKDLEFHTRFIECLNCDSSNKIILHIGGVYSNKRSATDRFIENYMKLDESIKHHLVIENDDKSYNIQDVLNISKETNIPVVFDVLHHKLNPPDNNLFNQFDWIKECSKTWKKKDGNQKIHFSQSANNYKNGAHSKYIEAQSFLNFYNKLESKNIDIMLEVKDKNLSAIKCNLLTTDNLQINKLEREWAKYKYYVLSSSPKTYQKIRNLLKNKSNPNALQFYNLIEESLNTKPLKKTQINSLQHIWGYFKKTATEKEKEKFKKLLLSYTKNERSITYIKNYLYKLAYKYSIEYLLDSLYFYL